MDEQKLIGNTSYVGPLARAEDSADQFISGMIRMEINTTQPILIFFLIFGITVIL